ncbi:hypothetical protein [Thioalkalivibrio sp. ARh3]|uniref:hypothetical protein n=1 Tax=Thioalkalivibrio sp. ARh3 TaxID=1158148 RepID=UPI000381E718|nr:hypothetical protein [Thioalkalivibrio sp. ARh3]
MVEIEQFLPDVLPEVPGCPEPMAERQILDATIRFCRDTYAWQAEIDQLRIPEGGRDRFEFGLDFINTVNGSDLIALTQVGDQVFTFDGLKLRVPHASAGDRLPIRAALQPERSASRVPRLLYDDYREAIAAQALFRLLLQSRAEWANPELAGVYRQQYEQAVVEERVRMARGHSTQPGRIQPQAFF